MRLPTVGEIDPGEVLDLEPITIPVVAWTLSNGQRVEEEFNFRPTLPYGASFALYEDVDGQGNPRPGRVVRYIDKCLMPEELKRWREFLDSDTLVIEQTTVSQLFTVLTEQYAERPTLPRSDSAGTGGPMNGTSPAASNAKGSKSRGKRQPVAST